MIKMKNRYIHIIGISIILILIGLFYPIGLGITTPSKSYYPCNQTGSLPDGSYCIYDDFSDTSVITLLIILLPIIAIIGIIVFSYKPKKKENNSNEKEI